jgi:hypothetical protein
MAEPHRLPDPAPDAGQQELLTAVRHLVDRHRVRCLWFLRPDYYPTGEREIGRVLDAIERHGDRQAFQEVARLRQWLSQNSSAKSAS